MSRSQRVELQDALVLHRRPYQNSSLLLEVYTPEFGRVGLVARGARRNKSPWRGLLQPFTPLLLSWTGRGELYSLIHAEESQAAFALHSQSLLCGFYLNELLMRLSEREDPLPELFSLYQQGLVQLSDHNPDTLEAVLRLFELRLLALLGYASGAAGEKFAVCRSTLLPLILSAVRCLLCLKLKRHRSLCPTPV
ncbi:MAG: DNA repair protein RecO [Gammaproteobacteria bacterium]|nr:DNA repair protein RecO [Gammaproteobacteria bacterium]